MTWLSNKSKVKGCVVNDERKRKKETRQTWGFTPGSIQDGLAFIDYVNTLRTKGMFRYNLILKIVKLQRIMPFRLVLWRSGRWTHPGTVWIVDLVFFYGDSDRDCDVTRLRKAAGQHVLCSLCLFVVHWPGKDQMRLIMSILYLSRTNADNIFGGTWHIFFLRNDEQNEQYRFFSDQISLSTVTVSGLCWHTCKKM